MRRILSILTTLLLSLTAVAQRYSVTVTPVLLPPYTLNLSELTAQGSAKMMATLTVNDLTARNLPVRLHFKLESAGITVENIPTSAVAPLFLNGGETQILTGADMAQYLRLDNLEFRGYSKESYRQTGQLPGGLWKVTVEVRHFHTGRSLSNRGTATVWVSIYDPPVLTAPRNGTEAPDNPSLPLVFSWQASKHTGGTVAVQYKLELWEMRMDGVPAQTVAASMTPIFETTTQVTSYTAIPTGMNLEPGIRYCWRVTVSDPSNQAQINKNGQSEVREFTYLHTCPPVDEVTAAVRNTQADFSWTPSPYHTHFRVEMLQEGGSSDVSDCYDSKFRLYDFPQGTTWRVRVRGECKGDLEADWSPWTDFSIDPPGTPPTNDECPDCGCDDGPAKREIENYELKELQPGDTIVNRTGRTRFIVLSAEATGDHIYSGQFYLWLELWKTKVRCDYTDLKVNTDGVILDGSWRSVHNDGLMVNPATVAENIQNIRNGIANATFDNTVRDTIKLGYAVQTIYKDENGRYIAILEDGSERDLTQDLSASPKTLVEDSEGNKMVVTSDQQLMSAEQYHNTGANNTLLKNDSQTKDKQIAASGDVIFKPSESQQFGFDAYDASTNNHPEIYPPLEGGSYRPAYKSVAQWQQDNVKAEPMQGVTFRNNMGAPYATISGDIILRGEPQPGETPVYAHVAETDSTTKVVGKLNLLTFEPREISVCLVPVNGATPPNPQTLEKELNKIFKPAVASVKVSTHSGITIDYANGSGFVHGGSGPLTVYSDDEKAAINALTDADDDTYYLFLVKNVTKLDADGNNTVVSGYMPVGYQHGFIFEQFDVARTIAHELSHGAFALHHTFSANTESFHADEGTTNNLMDYTRDGIALNHKQWRWMHEKHGSGLFGFLADEEESEFNENDAVVAEILRTIHNSNDKQEDHCTIENKGIGFESHKYPLGDKAIDIDIVKHVFGDLAINCNRASCTVEKCDYAFEKEGTFIKFIFTTFTDNENTDALEILVEEEYADELANWLFADTWEYLKTKDELTPKQIAIARDAISKVEDETKRGEMFLELQKKVPYHNQRDNAPKYKNKSLSEEVKTEDDRKYEADRMCNLTSMAMAIEMLGISKEDVYNKLVNDGFDVTSEKDKDFEDILDIVRIKKKFTEDRTTVSLWTEIADYIGVETVTKEINSSKKNTNTINDINKALSEGKGVILSMYNNKGHIVRVQSISQDGIVIDDPYGNVSSMAFRELKPDHGSSFSINGTDPQLSSYNKGSNCTLTWDDIDVSKSTDRGGTYEVRGNQIYKSVVKGKDGKELPEDQKKDYYVKDWINDRSLPGRDEYLTRTAIGNKTDRDNKDVMDKNGKPITENITYYTAHGGMLKYYVIFSKKQNN